MNQEELINPGCSNRIAKLGEREVRFSNNYFANGEVEDKGVVITYEVDCHPEYVRLSMTLKHTKVGKGDNSELIVFNAFYSFRVYRVSEMNANDFLVILENCVERINESGKLHTPPLHNPVPTTLDQLWETNRTLFDEIADKINSCPEVVSNSTTV